MLTSTGPIAFILLAALPLACASAWVLARATRFIRTPAEVAPGLAAYGNAAWMVMAFPDDEIGSISGPREKAGDESAPPAQESSPQPSPAGGRGSPPSAPRQVLLFSGHRVDEPGRTPKRLPPDRVEAAAAAIGAALDRLDAGPADLAITQGANGGDLLFAEACLARGVPVQLMLAEPEDAFIAHSVAGAAGPHDWLARYRVVRARSAGEPRVMPADRAAQLDPFERCNLWLLTAALRHGVQRLRFVCLWDGASNGDGPGGTAHLVREVLRRTARMAWIDTRTLATSPRSAP